MLAMLMPASPRIRPSAPIIPGLTVVVLGEHQAVELDLDRVAERLHEPGALLAAGDRAGHRGGLAGRVRGHGDDAREVG